MIILTIISILNQFFRIIEYVNNKFPKKIGNQREENEMKEETINNTEINNQNEIWQVIPGFNDYEASTMGRIRIRTTGGIVTPFINSKTGYSNVSLKETNGKYVNRFVHRLVL